MNKFAACFAAGAIVFHLTPGPAWGFASIVGALTAAFGTCCLIDAIREKP